MWQEIMKMSTHYWKVKGCNCLVMFGSVMVGHYNCDSQLEHCCINAYGKFSAVTVASLK